MFRCWWWRIVTMYLVAREPWHGQLKVISMEKFAKFGCFCKLLFKFSGWLAPHRFFKVIDCYLVECSKEYIYPERAVLASNSMGHLPRGLRDIPILQAMKENEAIENHCCKCQYFIYELSLITNLCCAILRSKLKLYVPGVAWQIVMQFTQYTIDKLITWYQRGVPWHPGIPP